MQTVKPIKPAEIAEARKRLSGYDEVIKIFNQMIIESWNGSSVTLRQDEIVKRILKETNITHENIFSMHYLDVEDDFRAQGWKVEYDKPGYCETYEATFTFKK